MRALVTQVSTACAIASNPVAAVTERGSDSSSSGSRIATLNAALASPQAIFSWVTSSETSAYDCASLPVPAVVGTPIIGGSGCFALA